MYCPQLLIKDGKFYYNDRPSVLNVIRLLHGGIEKCYAAVMFSLLTWAKSIINNP